MKRVGWMVLVAWFLVGCGEIKALFSEKVKLGAQLTFYERIRTADEIGNATIGPGYVTYVHIFMNDTDINEYVAFYDTTDKETYECRFDQECIYEPAPYEAQEPLIDFKSLPVAFDYLPTVDQIRKDFLIDDINYPTVILNLHGANAMNVIHPENADLKWMITFMPDSRLPPSTPLRSFWVDAMTGTIESQFDS